MHSSRSVSPQQDCLRRYAAASDAFFFFNRLTAPDLFDVLEGALPAHRERLFPPTETLSMFMALALKPGRSCQGILKALYKHRREAELNIRDIKTTLGMQTLSCRTPGMGEKEM
jgi:hypothetical protein